MSKTKFKKYLEEKGVYHEGYDFLLSILADQIRLYNESKKTIKEEGISVWGSAEQNFKVRNQHFKTLDSSIANITKLTEKLGLSPRDSIIFRELGDRGESDGFEDLDEFES